MMSRPAVCYVATTDHLFQTVLSATQARAQCGPDVEIIVVHLHDGVDLAPDFARVCVDADITLIPVEADSLRGLPVAYARLLLDRWIDDDVEAVLYLDGDTQVLQDLRPLLAATPPALGVIAVKDPMVALHRSKRFEGQVGRWWRESAIPAEVQSRYINSGVLRVARADLPDLRRRVLALRSERAADPRFPDQDLINLAVEDRVQTIPLSWNFPGFLIGSSIEREAPRVVHFMSYPRPWEAPYEPWGQAFHAPYAEQAERYPELTARWRRAGIREIARYRVQQRYKILIERPVWESDTVVSAFDLAPAGGLPI